MLVAVAEIGLGGSVLWLVPGLAVGGLGMGVTLSGLVGVVMGSVQPSTRAPCPGRRPRCSRWRTRSAWPWSGSSSSAGSTSGMVDAFEASLVYLVATTVAVAVAAVFLPGRPRPAVEQQGQSAELATSSSAAA